MSLLKVCALVMTALALMPSAAHLFELPAKIAMTREDYFTVQAIYAGWSLFALPIFAAIAANVALGLGQWWHGDPRAPWAGVSALLIVISLMVFFVWVYPGNSASRNWTAPTDDWATLRIHWEYGHAAEALIVFAAFVATCIAATSRSSARTAGG